jgi:F-type H+-transporting ATPase subunit delta
MINVRAVASRYAQALSEAIPKLEELDSARKDLRALADAAAVSGQLRRVIENPVIDGSAKARVLRELIASRAPDERVLRFIDLVAARDRLGAIGEIATALEGEFNRRSGVREVEVASAAPLDDEVRERLESVLERVAGGRVTISERVDPDLLGGVVARIGGTLYDASLKTRLEKMRSRLVGVAGSD